LLQVRRGFLLYLMEVRKIIFTVTNDLNYDQRMQRICGSLAGAGYEVLLVGRELKRSTALVQKNYQQKRLKCWFSKGKLFYTEINIRLFLFLLFKKADCICAIDLDTILPCYYISQFKGIIRVYDAHEFFSQLDEVVSRPAIYRFWHRIESRMLPEFKSGYTVCESLAEEFKKNYNADYKVIRNVPLLKDDNGTSATTNKVILYQGAVNKGRGLDQLVLAMKNVNAVLWVCGDGNFMNEMKAVVQTSDLASKVIFHGMLEPEVLEKKAKEACVAINTFEKTGLNQYLSLSNKFFDYIHAGIPQIAMNYPEYKKLNDRYQVALLIDELNPNVISNAINKLLGDKDLHSQLRQNCLLAKKELNWQNEREKLFKFYEELLNE
jgi:glycosyltransferase involved in cell wall biosynthesis